MRRAPGRLAALAALAGLVACRTAGNTAVMREGESLIFEDSQLCAAVITGDATDCRTPDCKALVGDNLLVCSTGDCAAIIGNDAAKCTNPDCKALLANEVDAEGKRRFTGDPGQCATANCRALIRGQVAQCTRR